MKFDEELIHKIILPLAREPLLTRGTAGSESEPLSVSNQMHFEYPDTAAKD